MPGEFIGVWSETWRVLLRELRKERLVHSVGATKAARWFLGAHPANCNLEELPS